MSAKSRTKASMDAEAVARMMAAQNDEEPAVETVEEARPLPVVEVSEPLQRVAPLEFDPGKVDGRTLRKTGREPFATRIKPETHEALRRIAYARRITIAEALESAVAAYDGG